MRFSRPLRAKIDFLFIILGKYDLEVVENYKKRAQAYRTNFSADFFDIFIISVELIFGPKMCICGILQDFPKF